MEREGKVVEVCDDHIIVKIVPHEQCSKCGVCSTFASGESTIYVSQVEDINKGDNVMISLPEQSGAKAAALCYMLPLLMMLAGYYGGIGIGAIIGDFQGELPGIVGTILGLIAGFVVLRRLNVVTKKNDEYMPKIIKKIN